MAKPTQIAFSSARMTRSSAAIVLSSSPPSTWAPWEHSITSDQSAFSRTAERTRAKRS